jgi:hypothetical protein
MDGYCKVANFFFWGVGEIFCTVGLPLGVTRGERVLRQLTAIGRKKEEEE